MPDKLKMFPLLIDRWVGGTRYMSLEEKGLYMELLLYLFTEQRPIKDSKHVARICGIDPRTSARLWAKIGPKFSLNQHGSTHLLVTKLLNNAGRIKGLDSGAYGGGVPAQEKEQEQEVILDTPKPPKKKKKTVSKKRFIPPTIIEVAEYCKQRNNGIDAEHWWHFYESKSWMIGDNKMSSWKSSIITWEKKNAKDRRDSDRGKRKGIDHSDTSWVESFNNEYGEGSR